MSRDTLRTNIRSAMTAAGVASIRALAAQDDAIKESTLGDFLAGTSNDIRLTTLEAIANALSKSVGELLGEDTGAGSIGMAPVLHSKIDRSDLNPRKEFDEEDLEELATSIDAKGLLQPIGVYENGDRYILAYGERRWRAIGILIDEGKWPAEKPIMAVHSPSPLDDVSMTVDAIVENLQRKDISPLEEANAFKRLREEGQLSTQAIADMISKSQRFVQKRLALVDKLTEPAQQALKEGEITLDVAQGLTRVPEEQQTDLVDLCNQYGWTEAKDVTAEAVHGKYKASIAIFDLNEYDGIYIDHGSDRYFDDGEQFEALQKAAAEKLFKELDEEFSWAEFNETYWVALYEFEEDRDEDHKDAGVIVHLDPNDYTVEVHKGLVRKPKDKEPEKTPEEIAAEQKRERLTAWSEQAMAKCGEKISKDPKLPLVAVIYQLVTGYTEIGRVLFPIEAHSSGHTTTTAALNYLKIDAKDAAQRHYHDHFDELDNCRELLTAIEALDVPQLVQLLGICMADGLSRWSVEKPDPVTADYLNRWGIEIPDEFNPNKQDEVEDAA